MTDDELQLLVEDISLNCFARPFRHRARFNPRLRTTGGRYLLNTHDIEVNPRHLAAHGREEIVNIVKHELCHYHLHLEGKGYRHGDPDFRALLQQVGGTRHCRPAGPPRKPESYRYRLICRDCGMTYHRKRRMDTSRYVCGRCRGRLRLIELQK